jgi:hypothetical protein
MATDPEVDPADAREQQQPVLDDDVDSLPSDQEVPQADAFEQAIPAGDDEEEDYPAG